MTLATFLAATLVAAIPSAATSRSGPAPAFTPTSIRTSASAATPNSVPPTQPSAPAPPPSPNPSYDAALAQRLGADARGMKMYVLVLLKTGPRTDIPKEENDRAFAGHFANMARLADLGKLVVAGPLGKNERYRGIFVFNVTTLAEAEELLATDPAVKAGALAGEAYLLYASAALQEVVPIHGKLQKD